MKKTKTQRNIAIATATAFALVAYWKASVAKANRNLLLLSAKAPVDTYTVLTPWQLLESDEAVINANASFPERGIIV